MKRILGLPTFALCAVALVLTASVTSAQTIFDNFDNGDAAWTRINPTGLGSFLNSAGVGAGNKVYRLLAPAVPVDDVPAKGQARLGAVREDATFANFDVTVDLTDWNDNSATHQSLGIVARISNPGKGTTDGYFFHYDPYGTAGGAGIWIDRLDDENVAVLPNGFTQVTTRLDATLDYRLEFTGYGDTLTGSVYLLSDLSTPLYQVSVTDSTYAEGYVGLAVADQNVLTTGNRNAEARFDNFSAVPEPATYAAAAAGVALVFAAWRRRPGARLSRA